MSRPNSQTTGAAGNSTTSSWLMVMSHTLPGGVWELAIVFRASLTASPKADGVGEPVLIEEGQIEAIGQFQPVDIRRWIQFREDGADRGETTGLVF